MDARPAGTLTAPRPAWRAYLLLSRVSNLPTVWTNVLAGVIAARTGAPTAVLSLAAAMSLVYTGGMFLNDGFDAGYDARHRPDRPVPAGDVSATAVFAVGFAMLAAGIVLTFLQPHAGAAAIWTMVLAAAVIYYDYHHKQNTLGPAVMGVCRGLVYCVAVAGQAGTLTPGVLAAAAALTMYVVGLTWIAKRLGPRAGVVIPILIAGISVFDAVVILAFGGSPSLAAAAVACSALTLLLQRVVPGA